MSVTSLFPKLLTTFLFLYTGCVTITHVDEISQTATTIIIVSLISISLFTYFKVIVIGPGYSTDFLDLQVIDMKAAEQGIELPPEYFTKHSLTLKRDSRYRVCQTCNHWKPDRCHHCSNCDKCILKMDHHCPWFADCIGYNNQKYFIQFLMYATLYSFTVLFIVSYHFYAWFSNERYLDEIIDLRLLSVWILGVVVSISVSIFTGFSIYQVLRNRTTIELYGLRRYREDIKVLGGEETELNTYNAFDLGSYRKNWEQVMGTTMKEWCFPIMTVRQRNNANNLDDKGLYFTVNSQVTHDLLESANLQDRLLRRVTPRSSLDITRPLIS